MRGGCHTDMTIERKIHATTRQLRTPFLRGRITHVGILHEELITHGTMRGSNAARQDPVQLSTKNLPLSAQYSFPSIVLTMIKFMRCQRPSFLCVGAMFHTHTATAIHTR